MQTLIASILIFGLLILVHELGHYFVARLTGIRVVELAIGFGPKLVGWTKSGIDYSLRVVPLGGFCRMLGENPEEAEEPDSFPRQSISKRAATLFAGSAMNLVLALVLFFIIFFFIVGVPDTETSTIGYIVDDSPAEEVGIEAGDTIKSIDGNPVSTWDEVLTTISAKPEQEITLTVERDGLLTKFAVTTELAPQPEGERGVIGIGPKIEMYSLIPALVVSLERFGDILTALYQVVVGQAPLDVAGPVGIVHTIGEVAQTGFVNLLVLTALISINLGIINLLPVPALDGGRLLFLLIEAVRGRPIEPEKEGLIHLIGFALLITLILLVTYQDVLRFIIAPNN
ncbi:MAG: RIP metalloprotease RseP [Bacillota bacterium]